MPVHGLQSLRRNIRGTHYADQARVQIHPSAVARRVYRFGKDQFPAQTVVDGQLSGYAPGILRTISASLLTLFSVGRSADIAAERSSLAKQEGGETIALCHRAVRPHQARVAWIEGQFAGSVTIARNAQVQRVAKIEAKLHSVIAEGFGYVINQLVLLLAFGQRAIAR